VSTDIALSVALTAALVFAGAVLFIAGEPLLLRVTLDSTRFGPLWWYPATSVALLNIAAIVVLWTRRRIALDLWLMVVMFLYAIEIPLSYYPDPRRFSIGWYAVRGFAVLSSSIVLMLLIHRLRRFMRGCSAQFLHSVVSVSPADDRRRRCRFHCP
jgi:hypothetical protein